MMPKGFLRARSASEKRINGNISQLLVPFGLALLCLSLPLLDAEDPASSFPPDSDLDHDGIPDAREYLDGTHPVNRNDGNPLQLFKHNFRTNFSSTILGVWGIGHLLPGFSTASRYKDNNNDHDENNL